MVGSSLLFMGLAPIWNVYIPHLYGKVIEHIKEPEPLRNTLLLLVVVITLVLLGYSALDWHNAILIPQFKSYVRQRFVERVIEINDTQHEELPMGDILSKMIEASPIVVNWFNQIKDTVIPFIIVAISTCAYFLYIDPWLGIPLVIALLITVYAVYSTPNFCGKLSQDTTKHQNNVHEETEDVLRNVVSVYEGNQQENELLRLAKQEHVFRNSYYNTMSCVIRNKVLSAPVLAIVTALFIYRCYQRIRDKALKMAVFVSLFFMFTNLIGSMSWVIDVMRNLTYDVGTLAEVNALLTDNDYVPTNVQSAIGQKVPHPTGFGFYNVTYKYPKAISHAFHELTLHFEAGKTTVITGDVGSGKSTLFRLVARLGIPETGDLYVDGQWFQHLTRTATRHLIRYVPQQPGLFNRSILDNILYGNTTSTRTEVEELLREIGLYNDLTKHRKEGLTTQVGKNGSFLSGGQRQLIWCIRILLHRPKYVIMDEPTASMDAHTKSILIKLLNHFANVTTAVLVTHDPALMNVADRLIVMQKGQVVNVIDKKI